MADANSNRPTTHAKDETGKVYGKLTVLSFAEVRGKCAHWLCRCECGNEKVVSGANLRKQAGTRSCGKCVRKTINGLTGSPEYNVWNHMKRRCYDQTRRDYKWYGGRGITICDRWLNSFLAFYEDMGPRPSKDHSIERTNNDAGYSKENCKWATQDEQKQNTRNVKKFTYNGETMGLGAWARKLGIDRCTLRLRLDKGWPLDEVFTADKSFVARSHRQSAQLTFNGETMSIRAWARKLGLRHCVIRYRLKQGWPLEKVLTSERFPSPPPHNKRTTS